MPSASNKFIYVLNSSGRPFYVQLLCGATLEFWLYAGPYTGAMRCEPGQMIYYPVDRQLRRYIRNDKPRFIVVNRTKRDIGHVARTDLKKDGSVIEFLSNAN